MKNILIPLVLFLQSVDGELKFVLGLWSAGDSGPKTLPYPNDKNLLSQWTRGDGRLTEIGMQRMFDLGRWLRQRYIVDKHFLSSDYNPNELLIESTKQLSAIESAKTVAGRLFPRHSMLSTSDAVNNEAMRYQSTESINWMGLWQPTPLLTSAQLTSDEQRVIRCLSQLDDNASVLKEFEADNVEWLRIISEHTGFDRIDHSTIGQLLHIEDEIVHGVPQPEWVYSVHNGTTVLEWLRQANRKLMYIQYNSKLKARLRPTICFQDLQRGAFLEPVEILDIPSIEWQESAGILLNDWINTLINATYYVVEPRKAVFTSTTTLPLLSLRYAMGIADDEMLKPGSMLLLELHRNLADEYSVRLFTRSSSGQLYAHRLPTCSTGCPLDQFITDLRPMRLTVEDLDVLCTDDSSTSRLHVALLISIISALFFE